jgi:hypothetical protein
LFFKNLQKSISRLSGSVEMKSRRDFSLGRKKARISGQILPLQLVIGENRKKLHILPETLMLEGGALKETGNFILFDPESKTKGARCFLRLSPGQIVTIGRESKEQVTLLGLDEKIAKRHLTIKVFDEELVFNNHHPDNPIEFSPIDPDSVGRPVARRIECLRRLSKILGAPIDPINADAALKLLEKTNALLEKESHRPTDRRGMPGGLVSLPDKMMPILIGDLHTRIDNLLVVLVQDGVLDGLEEGRIALVLLGDAVHPEEDDLEEMESSAIIMDLIFRLKLRFPEQVFYLRGNHDGFSEEIKKGSVAQGTLWKRYLKQERGKKYRKEMERFYDLLPYVICSAKFLACHAGAPMSKVDRDSIIDVRQYANLERELTESRLQTSKNQGGYNKTDVKRFRKGMGIDDKAPFIVGHTPMSADDTLWLNIGEIAGHHVVYSAGRKWTGAIARIGDCMVPLRFPTEPLTKLYNSLLKSK